MSPSSVLRMVDAVTVSVPDLDQGLAFYRDRLGHDLIWRNDDVGQAGLRGQREIGVVKQETEDKEIAVSKKVVSIVAQTPRGGAPVTSISSVTSLYQQDAPPCPDCGAIMIRSGACYKCLNCGAVSGCS